MILEQFLWNYPGKVGLTHVLLDTSRILLPNPNNNKKCIMLMNSVSPLPLETTLQVALFSYPPPKAFVTPFD